MCVCVFVFYVCDREWGLRRESDRPEGECAERADHCSHTSQDTYLCLHQGKNHQLKTSEVRGFVLFGKLDIKSYGLKLLEYMCPTFLVETSQRLKHREDLVTVYGMFH